MGLILPSKGGSGGDYIWHKYPGTEPTGNDVLVSADDKDAYPIDGVQGGHYYKIGKLSFEDTSWEDIKRFADDKMLDKVFKIGDEKSITYTTGEKNVIQIADFNHDTTQDGILSPVTFITKYLSQEDIYMAYSQYGYWSKVEGRTYVNSTYYNKLPSELKILIKPTVKKSHTTAGTYETTFDNIWVPSPGELLGTDPLEGNQYPIYYTYDGLDKRKFGVGTASTWWACRRAVKSSTAWNSITNDTSNQKINISQYGGQVPFLAGFCI